MTAGIAWVLIIGAGMIFVAVMGLAVLAIRWRPAWLAQRRVVVWGGIAFPFVVLSVLLVYSATGVSLGATRSGLASHRGRRPSMVVARTLSRRGGRVRLRDGERNPPARSGNASSSRSPRADVLHSFWVPNLAGKLDMIPGRINRLTFTPDTAARVPRTMRRVLRRPARADGALRRHAASREAFEHWRNAAAPARCGAVDRTFESHCAVCHTVRGSQARGTLGPDLTHVGSRLSIARRHAADRRRAACPLDCVRASTSSPAT